MRRTRSVSRQSSLRSAVRALHVRQAAVGRQIILRHSFDRETLFELLNHMFSALVLSGEIHEARATGKELYDLALRLDVSKLYMVLDAMALLACREGNCDAAARIVAM